MAKAYGLNTGMTDVGKVAVGTAVAIGAAAGLYLLFGSDQKEDEEDS